MVKYFKTYPKLLLNDNNYDTTFGDLNNYLISQNVEKKIIFYIPKYTRLAYNKINHPQLTQLNNLKRLVETTAKKYNFDFIWNSNFPINSLSLMRGYLFIENDKKESYLDIMFDGYWKDNLDISKEENLIKLLKKCNIDENVFLEGIKDSKIKDELKSVTKEAHDKDIFGAPTFVVNNKIFWGQDRLEFALEEYNK